MTPKPTAPDAPRPLPVAHPAEPLTGRWYVASGGSTPSCPECGAPRSVYVEAPGVLAQLVAALVVRGRRWDLDAELEGEGRVLVTLRCDGGYIRLSRSVEEDPIPTGPGTAPGSRRHGR